MQTIDISVPADAVAPSIIEYTGTLLLLITSIVEKAACIYPPLEYMCKYMGTKSIRSLSDVITQYSSASLSNIFNFEMNNINNPITLSQIYQMSNSITPPVNNRKFFFSKR